MAACGSLQHIFEKPLPENPTLLESLSWNQIKPVKPSIEQSSFTEIFGELHFKERPQSPSSSFPISRLSSSTLLDSNPQIDTKNHNNKNDDANPHLSTQIQISRCHKKIDSLQLCTEGLGFESSYDVEDLKSDINNDWQHNEKKASIAKHTSADNLSGELRRSRTSGATFPPPISCIGKSGKPWVCFKSYRHDGRFVLKEVRIPTQEFLHAHREDGRLKMHFVHPSEEIIEEDDEEEFEGKSDIECEEGEHEENSDSNEEADHDYDGNDLKPVKMKLDAIGRKEICMIK